MVRAIVDANVLFAFRSARDQYHETATEIVEGIDSGDLPQGLVTNYTLPEVLNPIEKRAGHEHAVETLDFLTRSSGFRLRHLTTEDFSRGRALYRVHEGVEITDAILVEYMKRTGVEYLYSFDDDFDRFDEITRLTMPIDPFTS